MGTKNPFGEDQPAPRNLFAVRIQTIRTSASMQRAACLSDFRRACPGGITIGQLQQAQPVGPLFIGLAPMEGTTGLLFREGMRVNLGCPVQFLQASYQVVAFIRASRKESFLQPADICSLQLLVPLAQAQWKPNLDFPHVGYY